MEDVNKRRRTSSLRWDKSMLRSAGPRKLQRQLSLADVNAYAYSKIVPLLLQALRPGYLQSRLKFHLSSSLGLRLTDVPTPAEVCMHIIV